MAFPGTYNFNYYAGDTFEFFVYPKNSDGGIFDDLNNYEPLFLVSTARGAAASAIVIDSLDETEALATVQDGEYISCTIKPGGGRKLTAASYLYDLQIENTSASSSSFGKVFTLLTGTINVTQDVAVT
jgi:hypothetical protein